MSFLTSLACCNKRNHKRMRNNQVMHHVEFEILLIPIKIIQTVNFHVEGDPDKSLHEEDVITLITT